MLTPTRCLMNTASSMRMFVCAVMVWGCAHTATTSAQGLTVEWTGARMTVAATEVPLATVLTEMARQTGSTVVGLEKAGDRVTVMIDRATLHDALRALLADRNYIYIQRYSENTNAYDRVSLWMYGTGDKLAASLPCRASAAGRSVPCEQATREFVAPSDETSVVATLATEPFPVGPSAAEAEAARLHGEGAFNPNASEGSLMSLANSADAEVRVRALQTLAIQNSKNGASSIVRALDDADPAVRGEALHLLLSLGGPGPETIAQLRQLLAHRNRDVRFAAAMVLGEHPGAEAEAELTRVLGDEDDSVKNAAAQALRQREQQRGTTSRQ